VGVVPQPPSLTRRTVLRAIVVATAGLLAGCRSSKRPAAAPAPAPAPATSPPSHSPRPSTRASAQPTLSPDELLARRVAVAEQALLAAYDAAAVSHPELAGRLAPFRADHAAHLSALVAGAVSVPAPSAPPTSPSPSGEPSSPSPSGQPSSAPPSSPSPSTVIFTQLAAVERSAAAARIDDLATTTGSLASLLASIGGCEASHAALLSVAT